jgi:hypothetical protein
MTRSTRPPAPASDATRAQGRQWSRHASKYDEVFLDPFRPGVRNPIPGILAEVPDAASKS